MVEEFEDTIAVSLMLYDTAKTISSLIVFQSEDVASLKTAGGSVGLLIPIPELHKRSSFSNAAERL